MPRLTMRPIGVLGWIALLLSASAVTRVIGQADMAYAENTPSAQVETAGQNDAVIAVLREREDRVTTREAALTDREQAMAVAGAQIDAQIAALAAAEQSLSEMIAMAETAAQNDLSRLTAVYENMKPADAAHLFENMDPAFSAGFMALMQPESAAAIMGGLTAPTAYAISVILAGRNAATPTE